MRGKVLGKFYEVADGGSAVSFAVLDCLLVTVQGLQDESDGGTNAVGSRDSLEHHLVNASHAWAPMMARIPWVLVASRCHLCNPTFSASVGDF
jgi:hypothetical protein